MKYVTNINDYINLYFNKYLDVCKLDFVDDNSKKELANMINVNKE